MATRQPRDPKSLPLTPAEFEVLIALADGEKHGYAIIKEVARRTGGEVALGAGDAVRDPPALRGGGGHGRERRAPGGGPRRRAAALLPAHGRSAGAWRPPRRRAWRRRSPWRARRTSSASRGWREGPTGSAGCSGCCRSTSAPTTGARWRPSSASSTATRSRPAARAAPVAAGHRGRGAHGAARALRAAGAGRALRAARDGQAPGVHGRRALTLALGHRREHRGLQLVWAVLLRPLPYAEPERLVAVWNRWDGSPAPRCPTPSTSTTPSGPARSTIAAEASASVNIGGSGEPERVQAAFVTANLFDVLGAAPALGRGFRADEERRGNGRVAILSDALWRRRFGADPAVVGRTSPSTASRSRSWACCRAGFRPAHRVRAWPQRGGGRAAADARSRRAARSAAATTCRRSRAWRPAPTCAAARAEMDGLVADLRRSIPDEHDQGDFGIAVSPLREDLLGDRGRCSACWRRRRARAAAHLRERGRPAAGALRGPAPASWRCAPRWAPTASAWSASC